MYEDFHESLVKFTIYVDSKRLKSKMLTWGGAGLQDIIF